MTCQTGHYLPCGRKQVRAAVAGWVERYGCAPEYIGRLRVHRISEYPIVYLYRGPVYIGPIPPDDVDLYPDATLFELKDFFTVWVREGVGTWQPKVTIDPLDLEEWEEWVD